MNKQELITIIRTEVLLAKSNLERNGYIAGLEEAVNIIEGFSDESQKPVVPKFVADWIEESKSRGWDLLASMCFVVSSENKKLTKWFYLGENKNIFARAWLDGYEVEKEKRYLVKIKSTGQCLGKYYINNEILSPRFIYTGRNADAFTRKELGKAGFGEVFNSPLFEVEEVKE